MFSTAKWQIQQPKKDVMEGPGYAIIHDAFYLPSSKRDEAIKVMNEEAKKYFGGSCVSSVISPNTIHFR